MLVFVINADLNQQRDCVDTALEALRVDTTFHGCRKSITRQLKITARNPVKNLVILQTSD